MVADFAREVARLAVAAGGGYRLQPIAFTNSVVFDLVPEVDAAVLAETESLAESAPDRELSEPDLERLVPDAVVGAASVAHVLALEPEAAFEAARNDSAALAKSYAHLTKTLDAHDAWLKVVSPSGETVTLDEERVKEARRVALQATPLDPISFTVRGHLLVANASDETFKILLDPDFKPPEMPPQTKFVEAVYTPAARARVEQESLWNQYVYAEISAERASFPNQSRPQLTVLTFTELKRA